MRLKSKVAVLVATGAAAAGFVSTAQASEIYLTAHPNKCLDDPHWDRNSGTIMHIYDCNGGSNQQWDLYDAGWSWVGSTFIARNRASLLCLGAYSGGLATWARQIPCDPGNDYERLHYRGWPSPHWEFLNIGNHRCLDVWHGITTNNNWVQWYSCNDTAAQVWALRET
jgi:Ricin-type beta-trefoil lectin domain